MSAKITYYQLHRIFLRKVSWIKKYQSQWTYCFSISSTIRSIAVSETLSSVPYIRLCADGKLFSPLIKTRKKIIINPESVEHISKDVYHYFQRLRQPYMYFVEEFLLLEITYILLFVRSYSSELVFICFVSLSYWRNWEAAKSKEKTIKEVFNIWSDWFFNIQRRVNAGYLDLLKTWKAKYANGIPLPLVSRTEQFKGFNNVRTLLTLSLTCEWELNG